MKAINWCKMMILVLLGGVILLCSSTSVFADTNKANDSAENLNILIKAAAKGEPKYGIEGSSKTEPTDYEIDHSDDTYKTKDGGYLVYTQITGGEITDTETKKDTTFKNFNTNNLESLTANQKQRFIKDMLEVVYETANYDPDDQIDDAAVDNFLQIMSNKTGMGSSMLGALMADSKPNYASANRIWSPFNSIVGTVLALLSIIVMALIGVTMGADIMYITIPAFQLVCTGGEYGEGGDKDGKGKGIGGIISNDAKAACSEKDSGNCTSKEALGKYLKTRIFGLVLLGICLLYLVSGNIYSFVGWFIDLFSGFLGF